MRLSSIALLALLTIPLATEAGERKRDGRFCSALQSYLDAAPKGFAAVTDAAGQPKSSLPGAEGCSKLKTDAGPFMSCDMLVSKSLSQATARYDELVGKVRACLPDAWTVETGTDDEGMKWTDFRKAGTEEFIEITQDVDDGEHVVAVDVVKTDQ